MKRQRAIALLLLILAVAILIVGLAYFNSVTGPAAGGLGRAIDDMDTRAAQTARP